MNEFTLIDNVDKISNEVVMNVFNNSIKKLRYLLRGGIFAIDSTVIATKKDFPGSGTTKRNNDDGSYEVIHGFKLFALYEVKSRIVVAIKIVPVNESDITYFLPVIKQGIENCGDTAIKVIIADRGFLSGPDLWELKHKLGIDFVVPAKSSMIVRQDAIKICESYENKILAEWNYGKKTCKGCGVDGLLTYLPYNPPQTKNNKRTNGTAINAVVVTHWRNMSISTDKQHVLLTSLPAEKNPSKIAEIYRLRSYIENCGFRELKQAAFLKHLPRRKGENAENAAYIHMILCVFAHTLFYAFMLWRRMSYPKESNKECLRTWRREQQFSSNNKTLFVVEGKYYAFLSTVEILDIFLVDQKVRLNC